MRQSARLAHLVLTEATASPQVRCRPQRVSELVPRRRVGHQARDEHRDAHRRLRHRFATRPQLMRRQQDAIPYGKTGLMISSWLLGAWLAGSIRSGTATTLVQWNKDPPQLLDCKNCALISNMLDHGHCMDVYAHLWVLDRF